MYPQDHILWAFRFNCEVSKPQEQVFLFSLVLLADRKPSIAGFFNLMSPFISYDLFYFLFLLKNNLIGYFSCSRDYTNPYLPVAQSAIEGGGQVMFWLFCFKG